MSGACSCSEGNVMTEREVVKTDKRYRRNLFTVYILLIVLGTVLVKWGIPLFTGYIMRLPVKSRIEAIELTIHAVLLLFIPAAIYLMVIGRKVCVHKAMPYPGMKVIHDTTVVRGKNALIRGWSMVLLGGIMIIMVLISSIITHNIIARVKHHPLFSPIFYGVEV